MQHYTPNVLKKSSPAGAAAATVDGVLCFFVSDAVLLTEVDEFEMFRLPLLLLLRELLLILWLLELMLRTPLDTAAGSRVGGFAIELSRWSASESIHSHSVNQPDSQIDLFYH